MHKIRVRTKNIYPKEYYLYIGKDILNIIGQNITKSFKDTNKIMIVTDNTVRNLYIKTFLDYTKLEDSFEIYLHTIQEGEQSKSRREKERIENKLLRLAFNRNDLLIAFGGGIVSDLTGFVASTFKRGCKWMIISTTLLSQVDACIGGKTAINTPYGKNLIGSFYNPFQVYCDINFLKTNNIRRLKEGFVELIKHFILFDKGLFNQIKRELSNYTDLSNLDLDKKFEGYLLKSIKIKKNVVEKDQYEMRLRKTLNFGHTIGHTIEILSPEITHGEAVAIGMIVEMKIGEKLRITSKMAISEITNLFDRLQISYKMPENVNIDDMCDLLFNDKKNTKKDYIEIVMLSEIGKISKYNNYYSHKVKVEIIKEILSSYEKS